FGEVIALLRRLRRIDRMVVVVELGDELVGLALDEAIVAVEAAAERPLIVWTRSRRFLHRRQMPLADREGRIARWTQLLGERRRALGDGAGAIRKARVPVAQAAHADRMVIAAGEQCGAGRRAQRGGVEIGVAQPALGEAVDVRRVDGRAVAAEVR